MKLLDRTCATPGANLAADEMLLDACEHKGIEVLRFWESPIPFVVVGYGNKVATEVNVPASNQRKTPILRRCSGGGTVVQGPGCLNYAVTLRVTTAAELATVTGTNRYVMERNAAAIRKLLATATSRRTKEQAGRWQHVSIEGCTDLVVNHDGALMKFSGNAQRRRRDSVLFHGTLLYDFDLALATELLNAPSKQPDYRRSRTHREFITNIPATAIELKDALAKEWNASGAFDLSVADVERLAVERYDTPQWNADR